MVLAQASFSCRPVDNSEKASTVEVVFEELKVSKTKTPIVALYPSFDRIIAAFEDMSVEAHRWTSIGKYERQSQRFSAVSRKWLPSRIFSALHPRSRDRENTRFRKSPPWYSRSEQCMAIPMHGTQSGRIVLTGGYWDNHIRAHTLDSSMGEIHGEWAPSRKASHLQAVTCLQLADDGMTLASGSLDCTVRVWKLGLKNEVAPDDYMQPTGQRSNISSLAGPTQAATPRLAGSGRDVRGHAASGTGVPSNWMRERILRKVTTTTTTTIMLRRGAPLFTLCSHGPCIVPGDISEPDIRTCGMDSHCGQALSIGRMLRKIQYPSQPLCGKDRVDSTGDFIVYSGGDSPCTSFL